MPCSTCKLIMMMAFNNKWMKHYKGRYSWKSCPHVLVYSPLGHVFTNPCILRNVCPLRSEETSVSLRLLERDKSLTFCKWPWGSWYWTFLRWLTGRRHPLPVQSDISEYASKSNCLKVMELLTVKYMGQLLLSYHMRCVAWPKVNFLAASLRKSAQARRRILENGLQVLLYYTLFRPSPFWVLHNIGNKLSLFSLRAHSTLKIYWVTFLE